MSNVWNGFQSTTLPTLLLGLAGALSGCALQGAPGATSPLSQGLYSTAGRVTSEGCSSNYDNVVPYRNGSEYDYYLDGSGYYNVCHTEGSTQKLQIHGMTHYSNRICIIPAVANPNTDDPSSERFHIYLKAPGQSDDFTYKCFTTTPDGVTADFTGLLGGYEHPFIPGKPPSIDYVFIVEQRFITNLQRCLLNNLTNTCLEYSFGTVMR